MCGGIIACDLANTQCKTSIIICITMEKNEIIRIKNWNDLNGSKVKEWYNI